MADTNKVHFGLKNVKYAVLTETTDAITGVVHTTYGTPKAINGAVNLNLEAQGSQENFYADDGVYYVISNTNSYNGDLEVASIPDSFYTDIFGDVVDNDGALVEVKDVVTKYFALLGETTGDVGEHAIVLYKCSATRPAISGATKQESTEVQTQTLSITAIPRADVIDVDGVEHHVLQASCGKNDSAYSTWFTAVHEPSFGE